MFTGLVQSLGTIQLLGADKLQVTCLSPASGLIMQDLSLGDSIAVDGVCLTVVEVLAQGFVAVVSPETRDRTTFNHASHAYVNLESSLKVGSKLGGHFVTGHIDGMGTLESAVQTATSWEMTFTTTSAQVARYIIPKGSIAINGISLTVAECNPEGTWFMAAVIPHTYQETNLQYLRPGSWVNLEGDILGKYVEKFLRAGTVDHLTGDRPTSHLPKEVSIEISPSFLAEHGYL
jgi:riboflavin synthase